MAYSDLESCLLELERQGQLLRIKEEVDPYLEMATIHLLVHAQKGPAILFEKVKGSKYRAVSNLYGTLERSEYIFRNTLPQVQQLIQIKMDPLYALKHPLQALKVLPAAINALPKKNPIKQPVLFEEIDIADLPLIQHWPMDGGAFVTLPQVYTEDIDAPGIGKSNLGMYRIQLNGNDYIINKEIGLHYQLHRGIGIHQTKANAQGKPLKVSIFVGGPPAHAVAAVMPLPENLSEMNFAGVLAGRRFHYTYKDGFCVSTDADFVITGEVSPNENKPEGPFGDHLGYYSLQHPFPLMKVHKVYAKKNAIWPFTVVGRPPQEDTSFGQLIHAISGKAIAHEIPGVKEVHAVDAAGVHPLLLAIGSERYTPYLQTKRPQEILTIANHILGTGQLSLAKFLWIAATQQNESISTHNVELFMQYMMERMDLMNDVHFYTNTTMDTLDYSGDGLNKGSKVVLAAYGDKKRNLCQTVPGTIATLIPEATWIMPGLIAVSSSHTTASLKNLLKDKGDLLLHQEGLFGIVITEDASWMKHNSANYIWACFTRINPSHDIDGVDAITENKHWGCNGPLILDATIKPHHAPVLVVDPEVEQKAKTLLSKYGF
jgi:4-hydroxy-3-polyprenylbenzoate decarboxylase